jgi:hypothetical protein
MGKKINKTKRKNDKINHPSVSFVRVYVRYAKRERKREIERSFQQTKSRARCPDMPPDIFLFFSLPADLEMIFFFS